ncbi:Polyphosphatidylinositol phosphatase [Hirschfeldia incana]|nr:Polyphosphatidylinositol phosphatase [Hirschfeldia incana]
MVSRRDYRSLRSCTGWRRFLLLVPVLVVLPHLSSLIDYSSTRAKNESPSSRSKKLDHLLLGPPAGVGFPDRLHCRGLKALNKTHTATSHASGAAGNGVSFVTVFTVYNNNTSLGDLKSSNVVSVVGNVTYSKPERSMAVLNAFAYFIQVSMPKSNVVVLTDPASKLSIQASNVIVEPIPGDYSRGNLMLQRIMSYITFLEMKLEKDDGGMNHYIFTDSDIAVVDNIETIFDNHPDFHIALTFRNNKDQPLNSGFIAVRGTREGILRAKVFLEQVLKAYKTKYMKASRMLGDQLALVWVVKSHPSFDAKRFAKPQAFTQEIAGASVLFLPCALYNWTPPEGAGQFHGMPLDVKIVHFKGSRKRLMLEAWNFHKSTSNIPDMLCLVLGSGRTKYDF